MKSLIPELNTSRLIAIALTLAAIALVAALALRKDGTGDRVSWLMPAMSEQNGAHVTMAESHDALARLELNA